MKAAGRTLTVQELLSEPITTYGIGAAFDLGIYVQVDGDPMPIVESDNGVLSTTDELYSFCYQAERDLLEQIAEDPKVWTKAKILSAIAEMGITG